MKKLLGIMLIFCIMAVVLVGCATVVPVTYTEPARIDMSGVNRIAIDSQGKMPVAPVIAEKLNATGKYTVATPAELEDLKRWEKEVRELKSLAAYQATATEVSAVNLVKAYQDNAARADDSYKGKPVKITAAIKEIGQTSKGRYYVRFIAGGSDSVDIFFERTESLKDLNKGQTITVIGTCWGKNLPDMDDTAEILRILGAGSSVNVDKATFPVVGPKDYPGKIDAIISLDASFSSSDTSETRKKNATDKDGNTLKTPDGKTVQVDVPYYKREVTVTIDYNIVRRRDSSTIGTGRKLAKDSSGSEDRSKLPDPSSVASKIIDKPIGEFLSEIVPTERTINITLVEESDNKVAKKEMSAAKELVKAKNYPGATEIYGKIYAQHKNFAAGYNHAVLTEATEGTVKAIVLMEALAKDGNPTAQGTLADMQRRNASNKAAAAQLAK